MPERIYLDYNATAPLAPAAMAAWTAAQEQAWANPSSVHREGQQARHQLDLAKAALGRMLGCRPHELILGSGGTEALATAIRGCLAAGLVERLLHGAADHAAVTANAAACGCPVTVLPVDAGGCPTLDGLQSALASGGPALVCLQLANNETGARPDLSALVQAVRAAGTGHLVLLDMSHGAGKTAVDLAAMDIDLAAFAGHKFGAPKGCGGLVCRGQRLPALIAGGGQQQDRRSGTEDAAMAAAMVAAMTASLSASAANDARLGAACQAAWEIIVAALPAAIWQGREGALLPGTMLLLHPGISGAALLPRLDLAGFAVSRGAACTAMSNEPSPAVVACGVAPDLAVSAIRVSAGPATGDDDLLAFARAYINEVQGVRG